MSQVTVLIYEVTDGAGNVSATVAAESSDTVQVWATTANGEPVTFESESYHLPTWCDRYGFKLTRHLANIDTSRRAVTGWDETTY